MAFHLTDVLYLNRGIILQDKPDKPGISDGRFIRLSVRL